MVKKGGGESGRRGNMVDVFGGVCHVVIRCGGGVRLLELKGVLSRTVSAHVLGTVFMLSLCLEKLVMSHSGD